MKKIQRIIRFHGWSCQPTVNDIDEQHQTGGYRMMAVLLVLTKISLGHDIAQIKRHEDKQFETTSLYKHD